MQLTRQNSDVNGSKAEATAPSFKLASSYEKTNGLYLVLTLCANFFETTNNYFKIK
jgi:hypothetical protein